MQREELPRDSQIESLKVISKSGDHLLALINDILDTAKTESAGLELIPVPLALPDFLNGVVHMLEARAHARGLNLSLTTKGTLPQWVLVDEKRLRRVLLNLLGNAIKFTERGKVTLIAEQQAEDGTGVHITFRVRDTGPGINYDDIERIFEPFEQAGNTESRNSGTGLGLSLSQEIVTLMGGTLRVDSTPGTGSEFFFSVRLPISEPDELCTKSKPDEVRSMTVRVPTINRHSTEWPPEAWLETARVLVAEGRLSALRRTSRELDQKRYATFCTGLQQALSTYDERTVRNFFDGDPGPEENA
jgi:K+-sensing histidine kinase KdpD